MIHEWRYHFLGGPMNGVHWAKEGDRIHDDNGLIDLPPTNEAWMKYRDAAAATKPGEAPPPVPPRVEYRVAASKSICDGERTVADLYMVRTTVSPDEEVFFLCSLASHFIDKSYGNKPA